MPTECIPDLFEFPRVESRVVVADFDGGRITSDAGALLLGQTDRAVGLTRRLAACLTDTRSRSCVEHAVETLLSQRIIGIALGYEDLCDHDTLRHDPVLAVLTGKLEARRANCAPLAGKSTLNRIEHGGGEPTRYHKIAANTAVIEALFVELFLNAHQRPPPPDHPRSRRHRRSAARTPGGPLLPWLLRLLLLPAALYFLRPSPAGGEAAPV